MNTSAHRHVGEMLHNRIVGALELRCRRGEMLLIQNKRVNWDTCQSGIPGATAKDRENRRIPFNPKGRPGGAPQTPRDSRIGRVRLRQREWRAPTDDSNGLGNAQAARQRPRAPGRKGGRRMEPAATATYRPTLARPQTRGRLPAPRGRRRHPDHSADARSREHSADATLFERDGRGTTERFGGELEESRTTASVGFLEQLMQLMRSRRFARLSRICPGDRGKLASQVGLEPTTLRLTA